MFLQFKNYFWKNPVLSLEVSRVLSCLSKFTLPQGVFQINQSLLTPLNEAFKNYVEGKISPEALIRAARTVEDNVSSTLAKNFSFENLGVKPFAKVTFASRIIGGEFLIPDLQIFVGKDGKELDELTEIERMIIEGGLKFEKGREKLIRLEGELLGYPECCIKSYVEGKSGLPAESRLIIECVENGVFEETLKAFRNSEIIAFPQFFTSNFYPCSTECKKAQKVGEKLRNWLGELKTAFDVRSMLTALFHCSTGLKASKGKGEYSSRLRKYYSTLKAEDIELLTTMGSYSTKQAEFTNLFIKRILGGFSVL